MQEAIYPGSFNRFHLGHLNILEKAEAIFGNVVVAQGINPVKGPPEFKIGDVKALRTRECINYTGTLTDLLRKFPNYPTVVRGLRSVTDLPEEIALLRYLQGEMPKIKVIHIICDAQYEHLSSTFNRALRGYGLEDKYIVQ